MGSGPAKLTLIASIGFSVDFILRRLTDLGGENRVKSIAAVGLDVGDQSWERVEQAYNLLEHYMKSIGIETRLYRLNLTENLLIESKRIIEDLVEEARSGYVEVFLTGGPRILVTAMAAATLLLDSSKSKNLRIVSYGEGFPGSIEISVGKLKSLTMLDSKSIEILRAIKSGRNRISDLLAKLDMPRSTLYKKLEELERHGLIYRKSRGTLALENGVEHLIE